MGLIAAEIAGSVEARLRRYRERIRGREHESLVNAIAAANNKDGHSSRPLVLLTAVDLRRRVCEAIEMEFPYVAVLCREELDEGTVQRGVVLQHPT